MSLENYQNWRKHSPYLQGVIWNEIAKQSKNNPTLQHIIDQLLMVAKLSENEPKDEDEDEEIPCGEIEWPIK